MKQNQLTNSQHTQWQLLRNLSEASEFWQVGEPSFLQTEVRFPVKFEGQTLASVGPATDTFQTNESIELLVCLPTKFPECEPHFQIQQQVAHPNLAADGVVSVGDLGLVWNESLSLDLLLERLWDMLRGSYFDTQNPVNVGVASWYSKQTADRFPLDRRPLTGHQNPSHNIIRYRKKGKPFRQSTIPSMVITDLPESPASSDDIFFFE